jgi:ABC-type bacteriocin/lantibiotic exporter with double-glycine peptidase domain
MRDIICLLKLALGTRGSSILFIFILTIAASIAGLSDFFLVERVSSLRPEFSNMSSDDIKDMFQYLLVYIFAIFFRHLLFEISTIACYRLGKSLSMKAYRKLINSRYLDYITHSSSGNQTILSYHIDQVVSGVFVPLLSLFTSAISVIFVLAALVDSINDLIAPLIGYIVVAGMVIRLFSVKLKKLGERDSYAANSRMSFINSTLALFPLVKSEALESEFESLYLYYSSEYLSARSAALRNVQYPRIFLELAPFVLLAIILLIAINRAEYSLSLFGVFLSAGVAAQRTLPLIQGASVAISSLKFNTSSAKILSKFIKVPSIGQKAFAKTSVGDVNTLRCVGIGFGYKGEQYIISDFTYTFETRKSYIIQGPSGSGKSTLLCMLSGLISPERGQVAIRDRTGRISLDSDDIRSIASICPQAFASIETDLKTNITLGREIDDPEIVEVLEQLNLGFLIQKLEDPDFKVSSLSGGQKQRLGIARTLLSRKRFLLLDEPTSALDSTNRDIIMRVLLEECSKGRCIIVVSHDAEIISFFDHSISLE